jgi:hypothetical protein
MIQPVSPSFPRFFAILATIMFVAVAAFVLAQSPKATSANSAGAKQEQGARKNAASEGNGELSWEMPGRLSIYDLQLGSATLVDADWKFLGASRTFNAGLYGDRLTIMVRFSYKATSTEIPLKFVVKLPDSRQYEETVKLSGKNGTYNYQFTVHKPEEFLGAGMIYLYYGLNIVDVLDFTIVPGS